MSTPEPPAPMPSATTRCAWCDRQLPLGAWTYCSADCKQEAWLHSIVPPASAPAATAEPDTKPACTCGETLTHLRTCYWYDPRDTRPAAPSGEEAETLGFLRDTIVRAKYRVEFEELSPEVDRGLRHIVAEGERAQAFVTAQAAELAAAKRAHERTYRAWEAEREEKDTELAALRARVEELEQQSEGWTKKGQRQEPTLKGENPNA